MKSRAKSKDWPASHRGSSQGSELEKELTKALDKSSSNLADRLKDIADRYKAKIQTAQSA
jgi:hypothetical protein